MISYNVHFFVTFASFLSYYCDNGNAHHTHCVYALAFGWPFYFGTAHNDDIYNDIYEVFHSLYVCIAE